jgi:AraC-like DNA-binding protein
MRTVRSTVDEHDAVWDVVCPSKPSRIAGVRMAGFRDRGTTAVGHRAIPHPSVTLALDFGVAPLIISDAAGREQRGSLVAGLGFGFGPDTVWVRGADFEAVQVRLSPVVVGTVLGVSPAELGGSVVGLDDVWGSHVSRICEQLSYASSWADRFDAIDALLTRRQAAQRSSVDPEVAWVWNRILMCHGEVRVDNLASEVGWSRKRLWSRFHSQIGLPPKRAATLVRFDHAAHRLAAGEDIARVAADGGYADQSHLHRDVVAFTGATPATMATEPWLTVDDIAWPDSGSE